MSLNPKIIQAIQFFFLYNMAVLSAPPIRTARGCLRTPRPDSSHYVPLRFGHVPPKHPAFCRINNYTMEKRIRQFTVLINENGMRLDEYLSLKIGRMTRSQANVCIKAGAVAIEPYRTVKPSLKVHTDDVVSITQTLAGDTPMYDDLKIIDENDDFWVFDKPSGMAVHPTANIYNNTVTRYIETVLNARPYVVHRLDKETSGILIVAKNAAADTELGSIFLEQRAHKKYEAVCLNPNGIYYPGATLDIDVPLGFAGIELPRITMGPGHLKARTTGRCLDIHDRFAWLELDLHTGRQHQIRVHLAMNHTPIVGDKLYLFGEAFYKSWLDGELPPTFTPHRHLLHASGLSFVWKDKELSWHIPAPDIMHAVFKGPLTPAMLPTDYSKLFMDY